MGLSGPPYLLAFGPLSLFLVLQCCCSTNVIVALSSSSDNVTTTFAAAATGAASVETGKIKQTRNSSV